MASHPEADRISFLKGNALADPLPAGFDLVCFKSMLHDWPREEAGRLLAKAASSLRPGGTLLIFERSAIDLEHSEIGFGAIPMLLFFRSYRRPEEYETLLADAGLTAVETERLQLEMPFLILRARRV